MALSELTKVIVAVPSRGMNSMFWTSSYAQQVIPAMTNCEFVSAIGREVGEARNELIYTALQRKGVKYILFWDEDVIAGPWALHHLFVMAETHPDISVIAGVYATKTFPPVPLVYRDYKPYYDWKVGEFFSVTCTGMGMTLIRLADLAKIDPFVEEYEARPGGNPTKIKRYFQTLKLTNIKAGEADMACTEDVYFSRLVEKAGLKWYVDAAEECICQHYDSKLDALFGVPQIEGKPVKHDPMKLKYKVCDLGCGTAWTQTSKIMYPDSSVVRVDLNEDANPDFRCDMRYLPEGWTDLFDEVRSSHALEHVGYEDTNKTLKEWIRVLKPGGWLKIAVPDLLWAAKEIVSGRLDREVLGNIFGDQRSPYWNVPQDAGIHLTGFTPADLLARLKRLGMVDIVVLGTDESGGPNAGMQALARKPSKRKSNGKRS